jgi:four helix bundle protein
LDDESVRDSGFGLRASGFELKELLSRVLNRKAGTSSNFASPRRLRRNQDSKNLACATHMQTIISYRDLEAWQLGMSFVEDVYSLTRFFPRDERFGLTSQLRRAAVSIPSLIAEGHRQGTRAYRHYVVRALGSQAECETQLELARRLGLVDGQRIEPVTEFAARLGRVLHGLARSLPET